MNDFPGSDWKRRLFRLRQDVRVLRRVFPWRTTAALLLFIGIMAWLFRVIHNQNPLADSLTLLQALYAIANMVFFQLAYTDVSGDPHLVPFFILVPILGLSLFSLAGFNFLHALRVFFVRNERGQRWQEALASTYVEHVVVCGLGSVGYRVARQLTEVGQAVVGIELTRTELVDKLINADLPVILGNIRSAEVLEKAGVGNATTVVVCTNHDMANIEAAFHVHELNPQARLVVRVFEDEIAHSVKTGAEIDVILSRSAIAAVAFAHAAVGIEVLESFRLNSLNYVLARVPLRYDSPMIGHTIDQVAFDRDVTIAFLCRDGRIVNEPDPATRLQAGDDLFLFATTDRLMTLVRRAISNTNGNEDAIQDTHVIVCGVGHVGYRTVNILTELGCSVTAVASTENRLTQRLAQQGICVQIADYRRRATLAAAGITHAQAIIICSEDDMLNLETGLRARELKPGMRVVMRIFEDDLGRRLSKTFGIDAVYSTSALAAPAFVGAALKMHLAQSVTIGDEDWTLTRLAIEPESGLIGQTIQALNAEDELTVVLHARRDRLDVPPRFETDLQVDDELVVLVSPRRLRHLSQINRSVTPVQGRWL